MLQSLRVDQFKESLAEFLVTFWENNDLEEYRCSHEEADSRMLFHISKCSTPSNIFVRTVDTDVLIIALGSLHLLEEGKQIWMETGLVTNNTFRYISINQIHNHFGVEFCKALPAFHAFTGCDYTASFNRKVKLDH